MAGNVGLDGKVREPEKKPRMEGMTPTPGIADEVAAEQQPAEPDPDVREPEPVFLAPEIAHRWRTELVPLMRENSELEAALAQYGAGVDPRTSELQRMEIFYQFLLETLFPPTTPSGQAARLELDIRYHGHMREYLAAARKQVVAARLAGGASVEQGLQSLMEQGMPAGLLKPPGS
jgi:hypothetical protein